MSSPLLLIAGPCVVEDAKTCHHIAATIKEICDRKGIEYIFKASFKKANRSKLDSFTGIGDEEALKLIQSVGARHGIRTLTDVHETTDCQLAARYVDVLQIPAFLCRQTGLLLAAGETGKPVNIKKGQFMSPEAMQLAYDKVVSTGNKYVWVTERGTTFGYQDLVVDATAISRMKRFAPVVIMDATHAVQIPNQSSGVTGGNTEMIETLCRSAIATGADGLFIEVHPEPARAKSDAASMLALDKLEAILDKCLLIRNAIS